MSAPAEPTGAGVFHLGDNDEGGDFDSWTLGHLPDGHIGTPVESESVLERYPRAPNSRRGSQRGRDQWERGLAGLAELCFGLLQLMERFLPGATSGDSSPSDIFDKDFLE
ncbi:hypothetical protein DPX16_12359 [Anabarilius grahami]|uniref:Uncharacterized protein n=1 Tax=Anabarilius grahami TaxID=495550 RepID=A0A3N0XHL4_ANAGA|nr:hypothetical protein DPX16_12359 [Anabarilius grahami]